MPVGDIATSVTTLSVAFTFENCLSQALQLKPGVLAEVTLPLHVYTGTAPAATLGLRNLVTETSVALTAQDAFRLDGFKYELNTAGNAYEADLDYPAYDSTTCGAVAYSLT